MLIICNDKLINYTYSNENERIISLSYKEINEHYNEFNNLRSSCSEVNYVYPDKLRIENSGEVNTIEIYNLGRFTTYDKNTKVVNSGLIKVEKIPKALVISEKLCRIIETGKYKSIGYEEKDNKKLRVITTANDENNNSYIKYWILEYNGVKLPYAEEYFLNNEVISKTSYIYQKINDKIDNEMFKLN
jgi:hypothetical protein